MTLNILGGSSAFSSSFGNKTYDTVYGLIKQCHDEQGINVSSILSSVSSLALYSAFVFLDSLFDNKYP